MELLIILIVLVVMRLCYAWGVIQGKLREYDATKLIISRMKAVIKAQQDLIYGQDVVIGSYRVENEETPEEIMAILKRPFAETEN